MASVYFLIFWIPSLASVVMFVISWRSGLLKRPVLVVVLSAFAFCCQSYGYLFSPLWAIGLVLQTIIAVFLAIRIRVDL